MAGIFRSLIAGFRLPIIFSSCYKLVTALSKSKSTAKDIQDAFAAARAGKVRALKKLIANGVSPSARDRSYFRTSLLMAAAVNGHDKVFSELVKLGANLHAVNDLEQSVLQSACTQKGTAQMVEAILRDGIVPSDGLKDALLFACDEGKVEVVKVLLASGADANGLVRGFGSPLTSAVTSNHPKVVAILLKAGARTDVRIPREEYGDNRHYKKTILEVADAEGYKEIAALLKKAGAKIKNPVRTSKPSAKAPTVARSWKRIDEWLKENAPKWRPLRKGASPDQIKRAETKLGIRMPAELRNLYLGHAGSRSEAQVFPSPDDISHYFMSLTEAVNEWKMLNKLLKGGDFEGLTPDSHQAIRNEWWNERWIPFASNGGGDYFCVDMAPTKQGKKGQVITHNHESGQHKLLAPSIRDWLGKLANGLEDKTFCFDEDDGLV